MLRKIWVENFKAFGDPVEIDLRPITLLFGPNSSGKSSILHAIHYLQAVLETRTADIEKTRLGGGLDLGGFANVVYNNELDRTVRIGFEFSPQPDSKLNTWSQLSPEQAHTTASVEVLLRYSQILARPLVERFTVGLEGSVLATLVSTMDGRRVAMEDVNLQNEGLAGYVDLEEGHQAEVPISADLRDREKALPLLNRKIKEGYSAFGDGLDEDSPLYELILNLVDAAGADLFSELTQFRYVGPIRRSPPRSYVPPLFPDESRWASGLGAWDSLSRDSSLTSEVGTWLERLTAHVTSRSQSIESSRASGYGLELVSMWEVDDELVQRMRVAAANFELDDQFTAFAEQFRESRRVVMLDWTRDAVVAPCDLGEGIAQVIPIVAAALSREVVTPSGEAVDASLVAMEQPELHVHPSMQVTLGDLFLDKCHERQFLIETHSEHLVLRLLRRVRETTENELPVGAPSATPDMIAIHYIEPGEEGAVVTHIEVTKDGEFGQRWPRGFFPERMDELV